MVIDRGREKLIQSVIYFARNTRKLGKVKLFKLLYFLDFQHYRDTGRPVTNLEYSAWKMGPVPVSLQEELEAPKSDWNGKVKFEWIKVAKGSMLSVSALSLFDPGGFSRRELRLLEALAREYRDADSEDMIEVAHLENQPWHKIWHEQKAKQAQIPYDLALRKQDFEAVKGYAEERTTFIRTLNKK
jgi:uncharacterized phage-associated protein